MGEALSFTLGDLTLRVSEFALVPSDYREPGFSMRRDVREAFYRAKITWKLGDKSGGADEVILGHWASRDRVVVGMDNITYDERTQSLLSALDQVIGRIYGAELLEPATPVKAREYPEDYRTGGKIF